MSRQQDIDKLYTELSDNLYDIRCEALINQALHSGILPDDFVARNDGRFYREYRSDLYSINRIEDSWNRDLLQLHLSRPGLYDLLPEGLFHQPVTNQNNETVSEMAAASRYDRKKEAMARNFFQPLENGFFLHRVQLESEEEALLTGMDTGLLNDFFFQFWGFPDGLNKTSAMLLVRLLPYAHIIAGNLPLMQSCLSILLQEEVGITQIAADLNVAGIPNQLGSHQLGNDMVCGNSFVEDHPCLQYIIGPLQHSQTAEYLFGGENDILLQVFNDYFAPVEADVVIHVEVDKAKSLIYLEAEESPILGYSSML